jgi:hypothetical protein
MDQKMVRFGSLRLTRSRQDESIEVGEVGSKRPSSGGNGGHVVSLYPLAWRSLPLALWWPALVHGSLFVASSRCNSLGTELVFSHQVPLGELGHHSAGPAMIDGLLLTSIALSSSANDFLYGLPLVLWSFWYSQSYKH